MFAYLNISEGDPESLSTPALGKKYLARTKIVLKFIS